MNIDRYEAAKRHLKNVGFGTTNYTNLVVVAEALERGVEVGMTNNARRIVLSHDGKRRRWRGGNNNLNSRLAVKVTNRKDVCSRLLRGHQINMPENCVFSSSEVERAWQWAQPLGPLVVKPSNGNQGRDVYVGIENRDEFAEAFEHVAQKRGQVLVEQFHGGIEHRCLVVDDKLVAATRRRPASVLGDGASSIDELIEAKNLDRGRIHKPFSFKPQTLNTLADAGYSTESVPPCGERVYLLRTSNIHTGGDAIDATDEMPQEVHDMIETASRAVPGLRISGFDILLPEGAESAQRAPTLLEINASPMVSMHHFPWEGEPRDVARVIVDAMFPALKAG